MNNLNSRFYTLLEQHCRPAWLGILLTAALGACSSNSTDQSPENPVPANPVQESLVNEISRPSLSAAQLSNDANYSIQSALSVAAGGEPIIIQGVSQAVEQAFATAGSVPEPVSLMPTVEAEEPVGGSDENTELTVENEPEPETSNPSKGNEQVLEPEPESTPDEGTPDNNTPADNTPDGSTNNGGTAGEEPNESDRVTPSEKSFVSATTPGFEGEVLEDSIRIRWQSDDSARGYNVYRQAQYIDTVFTTEYIDSNVYDGDYYYEIQAFDFDESYYYVATGLTVSATTLGRVDPDAPAVNEDLLNDYELVFNDEFDGEVLDTSKWNTSFLWGPGLFINSEEQYYVDVVNYPDFGFNPFTFDGQFLTINSIKTPPELSDKALRQPYLSGLITSYDSFKFTYGYVETRARFTHGRGYWPAFWLLNAYYVDAKPEIDIMEFIGDNQDVVYHTYHYFDAEGNLRSTESMPTVGIDFTADFHTFGVEWLPGTLIFYVDGIERHRVTDPNVSSQEMYVLANTAIGGWWAGSPDETTPFPGEYVLDYIRVYQKITPFDDIVLDDGQDSIPLSGDNGGRTSPNHRPSIEQWPEGYPDGT